MTDLLPLWRDLLLGGFILLAYTTEAMTGFGSIVIALSLGALILPIDDVQTVLVPLNICMTGFLSWRHRNHIDWRLLGRLIMPFMLAGTVLGYWVQPVLGGALLKVGFALLVLWFVLRELRRAARGHVAAPKSGWWSRGIVLGAGVTHGLFASGGPLLVYGLAGLSLDKARFRATLILVWFSLNSLLTLLYLNQGRLQPLAPHVLAYLPLIPLGIVLGERLHHRVDEVTFRLWIYRVLAVSASALLLASLLQLG
ncbi:sulfite exporter TauE/SafE family protein [Sinimarinibacterium sp. CAU 1509]|uniref:sulfite exporter TauE/SafE family protein n=1 Tax=Sinimarinibacterium sp. CAU 1509 TaxID=2562283 RepID=UPI001B7FED6B|nr:sulfite exporter TauE/SafE family protein [Sinimarinibacterium sp. CAU 1509]